MNRITNSRSRVSRIRNRRQGGTGKTTLPQASREFTRAREWHNPLRNLTLSRAISLIETYPRGEFADLMWTLGAPYVGIETADADLSAILSRRCSALAEMDWNANPLTSERIDPGQATLQAEALHEMMDGISNLYEAIEHFQIAINRGFAHCEVIEGPEGAPIELRPVDQWHVVRDGIYGGWRYNPEARQTNYEFLGAANDMPADRFLVREIRRPLGRIALIKFVRANLSEADWGAFVERYGLASGVVTMPPDVSPDQEAAFLAAAEDVAAGGSGALPHGSGYQPNSSDKGSGATPFKEHLDYLQEKLVLVGTNGMLTMLTQSGSGTLAGSAHQETFDQLARSDARAVSEVINKQLVEPWLKKRFPGQPVMAHWELAFREEVDGSQVIEDAAKLKSAGHAIDPAELEEKTGYKLEVRVPESLVDGQEGPEGGAKAVQTRANAPEGNLPDIGAGESDPASDAKNDGLLKNRDSDKIGSDEVTDPEPGEKAPPSDFEMMLAGLLRGGQAAWTDVLAEAVADGSVVPGQESMVPGQEEEKKEDA